MTAPDADDPRRCTAHSSRTGKRCGQWAIRGGTVCVTHGGAAPQVKRAAALRLLDLVDPALGTLARALDPDDKQWGPSERLRAAADVLDRAGYPRGVTLEVTPEQLAARITELAAELDE